MLVLPLTWPRSVPLHDPSGTNTQANETQDKVEQLLSGVDAWPLLHIVAQP
jgi:hypothetical protein